MMKIYRPLVIATLGLTLSALAVPGAGAAPDLMVYLRCGTDHSANTLALQKEIDDAAQGTTLVLPPGVCGVAKCNLAHQGKICYGGAGLPHNSALHIGKYQALISNLTLAGAADGTSVLKLDPSPPRQSDSYD